ncbi:MAG TPA: SIMPL domain-containing protein [Caulobacteraceae bacterium]|jgi:hypothetical protein|nr:SIMPL domain-containing protein [Caulobacteraceae bacterium]
MKPILSAAAAALALMLTASAPAMAEEPPHGPLLTLSAYGETHAAPDLATITLGVTSQAKTAQAAMRANADRMSGLVAALKRQGVAEKDIQTSNLNLQPQYDYHQGVSSASGQPPTLTGYQASNDVSVTVYDLARLGQTVDAVVAGGANQVSGISFGLKDPQTTEDAARVQAVQRLQREAALYAKATGLHIKALRNLSEGGGYTPSPVRPMMMSAKVAAPTPVEAGQLDLRVDVSATYELEP